VTSCPGGFLYTGGLHPVGSHDRLWTQHPNFHLGDGTLEQNARATGHSHLLFCGSQFVLHVRTRGGSHPVSHHP